MRGRRGQGGRGGRLPDPAAGAEALPGAAAAAAAAATGAVAGVRLSGAVGAAGAADAPVLGVGVGAALTDAGAAHPAAPAAGCGPLTAEQLESARAALFAQLPSAYLAVVVAYATTPAAAAAAGAAAAATAAAAAAPGTSAGVLAPALAAAGREALLLAKRAGPQTRRRKRDDDPNLFEAVLEGGPTGKRFKKGSIKDGYAGSEYTGIFDAALMEMMKKIAPGMLCHRCHYVAVHGFMVCNDPQCASCRIVPALFCETCIWKLLRCKLGDFTHLRSHLPHLPPHVREQRVWSCCKCMGECDASCHTCAKKEESRLQAGARCFALLCTPRAASAASAASARTRTRTRSASCAAIGGRRVHVWDPLKQSAERCLLSPPPRPLSQTALKGSGTTTAEGQKGRWPLLRRRRCASRRAGRGRR